MYNFMMQNYNFNTMNSNFRTHAQHEKANEYKILCEKANDLSKYRKIGQTVNDWRVIATERKGSNFKGVLYEKDGQYVICYVGTERFSAKDWGANIKMATTGNSKQIEQANEFADKMIRDFDLNENNTTVIGHSEGGTEATVVGVKHNFKTVTFNAFGISEKHLEPGRNYDELVTNYIDKHDPIHKLHANVGVTLITPSTQNSFMAKTPFGSVQSHSLNKMGDCTKAIPVEEYKKNHPNYIDKIEDIDISREDIKNMDNELFQIYEKEIDKRLKNNQIKQKSNNSEKNDSGSSGNSGGGKWVTINGNHVLLEN